MRTALRPEGLHERRAAHRAARRGALARRCRSSRYDPRSRGADAYFASRRRWSSVAEPRPGRSRGLGSRPLTSCVRRGAGAEVAARAGARSRSRVDRDRPEPAPAARASRRGGLRGARRLGPPRRHRAARGRAPAAGPARYELIAGERRWRAARLAGLDDDPGRRARGRRPRARSSSALVENLVR